jgi:hypothetical protein
MQGKTAKRKSNVVRPRLARHSQTDHACLVRACKDFANSLGAKKMKTLRQTCVAAILSLTLAVSVLAGHIDTTGAPAPSPTPSASTTSTTIVLTVLSLIYP